jgi:hypothetical protein
LVRPNKNDYHLGLLFRVSQRCSPQPASLFMAITGFPFRSTRVRRVVWLGVLGLVPLGASAQNADKENGEEQKTEVVVSAARTVLPANAAGWMSISTAPTSPRIA